MASDSPPIFTAIASYNGDKYYDNTWMVTAAADLHYDGEIPMGNNEEEEEEDNLERKSFPKMFYLGILVGFLTQVVSLVGAHAMIMLVHWGGDNNNNNNNNKDVLVVIQEIEQGDDYGFHYQYTTILSILVAQIDLCIYLVITMASACAITRLLGMPMLREQQIQTTVRSVLYFLVGIMMGTFIALSMIDVYLGFPIPFLLSIATATVDMVFLPIPFLLKVAAITFDLLVMPDDLLHVPVAY